MKYLAFLLLSLAFHSATGQRTISPVTPYDGDTIVTKNPLIGWFVMGGNASENGREYYRLTVVELKDQQSAEAGVTVNTPILKLDPVQGTQVFYPYDAPELEEGKHYGWQVQRIVNNVVAEKSEAWEFILAMPKEEFVKYAMLKTKPDGTTYEAEGGRIFFKMDESYYSETIRVLLYDENMQPVRKSVADDSQSGEHAEEFDVKSNGSNFYELDLGGSVKKGTYQLHVYDAKDNRYILHFHVS